MTTDFPTKNKTRAKRRKHKMKHRSPYAKELETHKYRQRIKSSHDYDSDDSWKEDVREYYGTQTMDTEDLSKTGQHPQESSDRTGEEGTIRRELVEKTDERIQGNYGEAKD